MRRKYDILEELHHGVTIIMTMFMEVKVKVFDFLVPEQVSVQHDYLLAFIQNFL